MTPEEEAAELFAALFAIGFVGLRPDRITCNVDADKWLKTVIAERLRERDKKYDTEAKLLNQYIKHLHRMQEERDRAIERIAVLEIENERLGSALKWYVEQYGHEAPHSPGGPSE